MMAGTRDEQDRRLSGPGCKHQLKITRSKASLKFQSNAELQAASEKMLKELLAEYKIDVKDSSLFSAILEAKLGKRFHQERRKDKLKVLAAGCALYHTVCQQPDPKEALQRLAASMDVDLPRTSDPCRIIVEALVDYGGTKDEKTRNRQFAARDARALRYVIRTDLDPAQVAKPAKGETITKWADREAAYRAQQNPAGARRQQAPARSAPASAASNQLPVVRLPQAQYGTLLDWLGHGLVVVASQDGRSPLAVAVARLKHLTASQAKIEPAKVHAAFGKALENAAFSRHTPISDIVHCYP
jgi:hypothetical protein